MQGPEQFSFVFWDYFAIIAYFVIFSLIGLWAGRKHHAESGEYFLAGRTLPWYVVGGSFIASNISSEHFIGMVGAFGTISNVGARPELLASDISKALITTLMGLCVAIPTMAVFTYLRNRIDHYAALAAQTIEDMTVALEPTGQQAKAPAAGAGRAAAPVSMTPAAGPARPSAPPAPSAARAGS